MGFELTRFQGEVDEELICPICSGVLEEALQASVCEHAFCRACITEWLSRQPTCPVDRQAITTANLRAVPRILRNLLSRLCIACDNAAYGCPAVLKLDCLVTHLTECEHNPKRPLPCEQGCGLVIPKDELMDHNCVRELRSLIHSQQQKLAEFKQEISEQAISINELKREIHLLKDFMRAMRVSNPAMRAIADQMERDEVSRWSGTLARARVTRWGGMISTPDDVLQLMIKRSLSESGCPPHILDDLMENCHERRWPQGLCSLETRQNNRRLYENYVCKRVPGKQAVLVLQCDNAHMSEEMMIDPGLVMIFAHGIETDQATHISKLDPDFVHIWTKNVSLLTKVKSLPTGCESPLERSAQKCSSGDSHPVGNDFTFVNKDAIFIQTCTKSRSIFNISVGWSVLYKVNGNSNNFSIS